MQTSPGLTRGIDNATRAVDQRGPRYAVIGTIRAKEYDVEYADTAEKAERIRERFEDVHYHSIRVHPPEGSVNLQTLGKDRQEAKRVYDEKTAVLRAGVLRALEDGRAEAEVARAAGVDRMTVRSWAGK